MCATISTKCKNLEERLNEELFVDQLQLFVDQLQLFVDQFQLFVDQLQLFVDQLHSLLVPTVVRTTDIKTELVCGANTEIR